MIQDAIDNQSRLAKADKLAMPVFAIGAEKSFGTAQAEDLRFVVSNVTGGIMPDSVRWVMQENPRATIKLVTQFLDAEPWTRDILRTHPS